jgi:pimeloyl-ACP methyl ester carboxylesterase
MRHAPAAARAVRWRQLLATVPIHFVHGRSDRKAPLEYAEAIAAQGRHAEVVAVDRDLNVELRCPEVSFPFLYDSLT